MAAPGPNVRAGRLVILGASGDLTERYLLAALAEMACFGFLPADSTSPASPGMNGTPRSFVAMQPIASKATRPT